jgi:hypothetical protein
VAWQQQQHQQWCRVSYNKLLPWLHSLLLLLLHMLYLQNKAAAGGAAAV